MVAFGRNKLKKNKEPPPTIGQLANKNENTVTDLLDRNDELEAQIREIFVRKGNPSKFSESDKRRIMWNKTQIAKNSGQIANLSTHQNRLNSLNNVKSNAQNTQDMANQVKMVNKDVRNITKKIDVKSIMKNAIKLEKSNLELEIMDDMMNFGTLDNDPMEEFNMDDLQAEFGDLSTEFAPSNQNVEATTATNNNTAFDNFNHQSFAPANFNENPNQSQQNQQQQHVGRDQFNLPL